MTIVFLLFVKYSFYTCREHVFYKTQHTNNNPAFSTVLAKCPMKNVMAPLKNFLRCNYYDWWSDSVKLFRLYLY